MIVARRPSAEIRVVEVQKLRTFYDFCGARATLCGDSRGRGSKTGDFLRFLLAARDPLRRFAWSRSLSEDFTISAVRARPSEEIRVVEVQKLETFYDFCWPRATLCGDSRGRGSKTEDFLRFLRSRATLCGDSRGRGSKTEDFLRFLRCARDPLRRFAWSRFKNWGISAVRARPSAEIRVVEVQKLRTFYDFCWPRATLCGGSRGRGSKTEDFFYDFCGARATLCRDRARRSALAVAPCEFVLVSANPLRRLCVPKRSRCGAVQYSCSRNGLWKLSRGLRACLRNPAVAGSIPPWSAAAPA